MSTKTRDCFTRLLTGGLLNFALVALTLTLRLPASGEWLREYYFHMVAGAVAGITLVIIAPALWRGKVVEVILALFFSVQPAYRLLHVYAFWQQVRWGCC
jgi:hypothetical protein